MTTWKRTDELAVGDTVQFNRTTLTAVTYTHLVPANDARVLVFDNGASGQWDLHYQWEVPTEEELAAAKQAARTEGMAQALEHAAKLIRDYRLPPALHTIDVGVVVDTIADLEEWAGAVGAQVGRGGTDGTIPAFRMDGVAEFGGVALYVSAQAMEPFRTAAEGIEAAVRDAHPAEPAPASGERAVAALYRWGPAS
jgi:hypothetical protein